MSEWNLSEKVHRKFYFEKDVKELIRLLKEIKIMSTFSRDDVTAKEAEMAKAIFRDWQIAFFENLDKLAGEKLI